jgi:hypothetical protein
MELDDVVLQALQHLAVVDFTKTTTPDSVSLFETTVWLLAVLSTTLALIKYIDSIPRRPPLWI